MSVSGSLSKSSTSRLHQVRNVLAVVFALNILVALAKYAWGVYSQSTSMQADGIHSIFDSAGNIVGMLGIMFASRPADDDHPYGHSKFETYASVVIGLLLLAAAFEVGSSAIHKLMSQNYTAEITPVSFIVMILTLMVNTGVTLYERRWGKRLKSDVLLADASHTLSDSLVSIGVIIGLVLVGFGFPMADPIMALVVTVAILFTAWEVFRRASAVLSDKARIPEKDIHDFVCSVEGVDGAHQIRTRGTEGEVYADLHVIVDPYMTVQAAHDLSDDLEDRLKAEFPVLTDVLIHIEPNDGTRTL